LFIPRALLLPFDYIKETGNGQIIQELFNKEPESNTVITVFIIVYILFESRKEAAKREFGPMLDLLPVGCKDFPILFDDEEHSYLDGSAF
jgi:hypothetical protein